MENTKLSRSITVIDRILRILQGFAVAAFIVAAIFIPLTAFLGEKIIANSSNLQIGVINLRLSGAPESYLDTANIKASIIFMLVGMLLVSAAVWYCLKVLREILSLMKEGTPFASGISGKVKKLAWTVLIGGFVGEAGKLLSEIFTMRAYDMQSLFNTELVSEVGYNYSVDLWFVIAALILFFLSFVFGYGEGLQKESDETL